MQAENPMYQTRPNSDATPSNDNAIPNLYPHMRTVYFCFFGSFPIRASSRTGMYADRGRVLRTHRWLEEGLKASGTPQVLGKTEHSTVPSDHK